MLRISIIRFQQMEMLHDSGGKWRLVLLLCGASCAVPAALVDLIKINVNKVDRNERGCQQNSVPPTVQYISTGANRWNATDVSQMALNARASNPY